MANYNPLKRLKGECSMDLNNNKREIANQIEEVFQYRKTLLKVYFMINYILLSSFVRMGFLNLSFRLNHGEWYLPRDFYLSIAGLVTIQAGIFFGIFILYRGKNQAIIDEMRHFFRPTSFFNNIVFYSVVLTIAEIVFNIFSGISRYVIFGISIFGNFLYIDYLTTIFTTTNLLLLLYAYLQISNQKRN